MICFIVLLRENVNIIKYSGMKSEVKFQVNGSDKWFFRPTHLAIPYTLSQGRQNKKTSHILSIYFVRTPEAIVHVSIVI